MKTGSWIGRTDCGMGLVLFVACLSLASCAQRPTQATNPNLTARKPAQEPLSWSACSVLSSDKDDQSAQCTKIMVPLDWRNSGNRQQIPIFVKRVLGSSGEEPRKQIWLIDGGPGGARTLEVMLSQMTKAAPNVDFYIRDHRGTGESARLACPEIESGQYGWAQNLPPSLWKKCIVNAGGADYLSHFTITNAARDLAYIISQTRQSQQDVHVAGFSYGTHLTQRYLEVSPEFGSIAQPTSVILGGVGAAGISDLTRWDIDHNALAKKIFDACDADIDNCGKKFGMGNTSWSIVAKVVERLRQLKAASPNDLDKQAGCGGFRYDRFRGALALFSDDVGLRDTLPALVCRMNRCNPVDDDVIRNHFRAHFLGATSSSDRQAAIVAQMSSEVLQNVITLSELIKLPLSSDPATLDPKLYASAQYGFNLISEFNSGSTDLSGKVVPPYNRDSYFGKFAEVKVPMLFMNGTMDSSTPIENARVIACKYQAVDLNQVDGPKQCDGNPNLHHYLVEVKNGAHVSSRGIGGLRMEMEFIKNPLQNPNTSLPANDIAPLDFINGNDPAAARILFGGDNIWGGDDCNSN